MVSRTVLNVNVKPDINFAISITYKIYILNSTLIPQDMFLRICRGS